MSTTLAFVIPWYGPDIPGGAEAACRGLAEHLPHAGLSVEVLTTCVRDFLSDWSLNAFPAGSSRVNGVPVRRFPVRPRDAGLFARLNAQLLDGGSLSDDEERWFLQESIGSDALYEFLAAHADRYWYVFIPYLYGTTYWGAQVRPDRSFLIPCLHDEPYARLRPFRDLFPRLRGLLFNSQAESALAHRLYDLEATETAVMGLGVETGWAGDAARFRRRHRVDGPYLLYAGRKDAGKNTPLLAHYFSLYRRRTGRPLRLVLIGPGRVAMPNGGDQDIVDLGYLTAQEKYDAYAGASVVCQPSVNESFSLVIMEGWLAGAPALVHGDCPVTVEHCRKAHGGLYFTDYPEFEACLDLLLGEPPTAAALGRQGRAYVMEHYRWEVIADRYREFFARLEERAPLAGSAADPPARRGSAAR